MSTSRGTSNSGTPNKSKDGILLSPFPDATQLYSTAVDRGDFGINGFTYTDEDPPEVTNTDQDCELSFLMGGTELHPVAVFCSTHGWKGNIS